jgi:hypothetical protein
MNTSRLLGFIVMTSVVSQEHLLMILRPWATIQRRWLPGVHKSRYKASPWICSFNQTSTYHCHTGQLWSFDYRDGAQIPPLFDFVAFSFCCGCPFKRCQYYLRPPPASIAMSEYPYVQRMLGSVFHRYQLLRRDTTHWCHQRILACCREHDSGSRCK